jgi:hypothetical protein
LPHALSISAKRGAEAQPGSPEGLANALTGAVAITVKLEGADGLLEVKYRVWGRVERIAAFPHCVNRRLGFCLPDGAVPMQRGAVSLPGDYRLQGDCKKCRFAVQIASANSAEAIG